PGRHSISRSSPRSSCHWACAPSCRRRGASRPPTSGWPSCWATPPGARSACCGSGRASGGGSGWSSPHAPGGGCLRVREDFVEEVAEVQLKRGRRKIGSPGQGARDDLRALVARAPPLDDARIQVDDPVLAHPLLLVEAALHLSIGTRGGR